MDNEIVFTINAIDYYMDRVFLEYEQPELFSVCDIIGRQYIVMLISDCPSRWLMTPISTARLYTLECGKISIRDTFINPEIPQVNLVENNNDVFLSTMLKPNELCDEYLPLPEAKLNWNNVPMPEIKEELFQLAKKQQRDIIDIRIISEKTQDHTIEAKTFASLLNVMNDTVTSLAKARNRKLGKKRGLTEGCALRYARNYAGSFGIILESPELSNLLDETQLTKVLDELFGLLQITDVHSIEKIVKDRSFDYSNALRKLLKFSSDNDAAMEFSFTTPRATYQGNAYWDQDFFLKALTYLDQLINNEVKDEIYIGDLVSVSTKSNNFEFITDTEDLIKGKIDPSLKELKFTVKSKAKINVKKSIRITNANETDEKYCLVGIEYITN